jgi:hypothetical protein
LEPGNSWAAPPRFEGYEGTDPLDVDALDEVETKASEVTEVQSSVAPVNADAEGIGLMSRLISIKERIHRGGRRAREHDWHKEAAKVRYRRGTMQTGRAEGN